MKKIIIFSRYFTPAIKAGGPIKSVKNILKIYGKKYNFLLVTGDRDLDRKVFKNIIFGRINNKGHFKVLYLKKHHQNIKKYLNIIKFFKPDIIYLNSFFDFKFSILVSLLNKFFIQKKLIISPRGELLSHALLNKFVRKKTYIFISKLFRVYSGAIFHLNSLKEKKNTKKEIGIKSNYKIVPVFYPKNKKTPIKSLSVQRNKFRILFVSRIVKNKNLDFCLKILSNINFKCELNIVGEIEDIPYWEYCFTLTQRLGKNIKVNYLGTKTKRDVFLLMRKSHCLLHPSKFESFGHVIFESLLNGLPIIVSNNTPWQNLKRKKIGANLSINKVDKFIKEINHLKFCKDKVYFNYRKKALKYAHQKILKDKIIINENIF